MRLSRWAILRGLAVIAIVVSPKAARAVITCAPPNFIALVLDQPGKYVLTDDIDCNSGELGVLISSSNVSLNLAGHYVYGGLFAGIVINDGLANVKIRGGGPACDSFTAPCPLVNGTTVAIEVNDDQDVRISGIRTGSIGPGITLNGGTNIHLTGNLAGIEAAGVSDSVFSNNFLEGVSGISLEDGSTGNNVRNNTVEAVYGIIVDAGSTGNTIFKNVVTSAPSPNFTGTNMIDENPPPCVNRWRKNTFTTTEGAGADCIH